MDYNTENFQIDVIERSKRIPVLVDFWAEWCGPCKVLGPILEKIAEKNTDRFAFVKLNTENHPDIALEYRISSIPNVKLFFNGAVVDEFVGALPENRIEQWLQKVLPDKNQKKLEKAAILLNQGREKEAIKMLQKIISNNPTNEKATVLLAKCLVFVDSDKAIDLTNNIQLASESYPLVETIRTFARLFRLAKNPDHQSADEIHEKYLIAIKELITQNFERALENFIEVMLTDRNYQDDGARKACIAIFKYLGEEHPITKKYRPKFSSALYV